MVLVLVIPAIHGPAAAFCWSFNSNCNCLCISLMLSSASSSSEGGRFGTTGVTEGVVLRGDVLLKVFGVKRLNPRDLIERLWMLETWWERERRREEEPESFRLSQNHSNEQPFVVSTHAVYLQRVSINPGKASGPDGIPEWLLKENADLLSDTMSDIINSSFAERRLPPSWKFADTVPIPKQT